MIFRRRRFAELVGRQLDLFETEHRHVIDECAEAERAYNRAARDDAEEPTATTSTPSSPPRARLEAIRDTYARGLEDETREEYDRAFTRAAVKRFPTLAVELGEPD